MRWRPRETRAGSGVLEAGAGDFVERDAVRGGGTHGPDGAVAGELGGREIECGGVARAEAEGGDGGGGGLVVGEEDADVMAAEGVVAGALRGGLRAAQRGEQEEDAGEMESAETHWFHFRRSRAGKAINSAGAKDCGRARRLATLHPNGQMRPSGTPPWRELVLGVDSWMLGAPRMGHPVGLIQLRDMRV